jgi:hypothetical protein
LKVKLNRLIEIRGRGEFFGLAAREITGKEMLMEMGFFCF